MHLARGGAGRERLGPGKTLARGRFEGETRRTVTATQDPARRPAELSSDFTKTINTPDALPAER